MDPTITYAAMRDRDNSIAERIEAAENLRGWIRAGGFLPDGTARSEVLIEIDATVLLGFISDPSNRVELPVSAWGREAAKVAANSR